MNYSLIYKNLIESRCQLKRSKRIDTYERHHILPKSLGGGNSKDNLVLLTPREHFLAHWLLYKLQTCPILKSKMAYAFMLMSNCNNENQNRIQNSRNYEVSRKAVMESCSGKNHPLYGIDPFTDVQKEVFRQNRLGSKNPMFGKIPWNKNPVQIVRDKHRSKSKEHKEKLSKSLKGRALSDSAKQNMSIARKGVKQRTTKCPHCSKIGSVCAMRRWHFDKCKFLPSISSTPEG